MALPTNLSVFFRLVADVVSGALAGTVKHEKSVSLTVGNAAGQANVVVQRDVSVTAGATQTIDLTAVADVSGAVQATTAVTHYAFENLSQNAGEDFTIGGGANPVIPAETVAAKGGSTLKTNPNLGWPVAGGTKNLAISVAAGANVPGRLTLWAKA